MPVLTILLIGFHEMQKELSRSNMKRNWFTISSLVSRDFKLKYRRSVLGVLWSVLNPLLMMLVMTFVFSSIFRFSVENYPLYVVLGNVLFVRFYDNGHVFNYRLIVAYQKDPHREADFSDREGAFSISEFLHLAYRSGDCDGRYARCSET